MSSKDSHSSFLHFIIFGLLALFCTGLLIRSGEQEPTLAQSVTIYYVDNVNGSDANPGTNAAPLKTIARASSLVQPGDTVRIKKTDVPYEETIQPVKSGTSGSPIIYEGWQGKPRFITLNTTPSTQSSKRCVFISRQNYITVRNIICDGRGTGGITIPGVGTFTTSAPYTGFYNFVYIYIGSYNTIENSEFIGAISGQGQDGIVISGSETGEEARFNRVLNNKVITTGFNAWHGIKVSIYAPRNLIEGNEIRLTGTAEGATHQAVQVLSSYVIVRNNSISNEKWTGVSFERFGTTSPGEHNIFEGNRVFGMTGDHSSMQVANQKTVIRNNFFYNNSVGALSFYRGSGTEEARYVRDNRLYQNTFYNNFQRTDSNKLAPIQFSISCNVPLGGNTENNIIKNNILFGSGDSQTTQIYVRLGCNHSSGNSTTATIPIYGLNGGEIRGNSILPGGGASPGGTFYYVEEGSLAASSKTITQLTNLYSSQVSSNIETDPLFTNPNAGDFTLRSNSPVVDKGVFLTKAYPVSGATIRFDDPHYFTDGYGLVPGDQIKFKTSGTVRRIQVLDYNTKTAILDGSVSLPAGGDDVALVYNGTAPDIGAIESPYSSGGSSPTPTNLSNVLFFVLPETGVSIAGRSFTLTIQNGGSTVLGPVSVTADTTGRILLPTNTLTSGSFAVSLRTAKYLSRKQTFVLSSNQTFTFTNRLLVGDLNSDNIINSLDWSNMSGVWFTNSPSNDLNEDGIVNSLDRALLVRNWFKGGE